MQENELIAKLKNLKEVKPSQEWVSLTKREILGLPSQAGAPSPVMTPARNVAVESVPAQPSFLAGVLSLLSNRKFAYAAIALMVVFIGASGAFGLKLYDDVRVANQAEANLLALKDNIQMFQEKSKALASFVEKEPGKVSQATKEIKSAAKKVADSVKKDPNLAKTFASEMIHNRTYLNIVGDEDLKQSIGDMYKAIAEPLIHELSAADLTQAQQESLAEIKKLYNEGNYAAAFEKILIFKINIERGD